LNRWGILAVLFTIRAVMGLQFQSIASTSVFLVDDLGIDFIEIGTLVGLYLLPGVVWYRRCFTQRIIDQDADRLVFGSRSDRSDGYLGEQLAVWHCIGSHHSRMDR